MITKNFQKIMIMLLASNSFPSYIGFPILDLNGATKYLGTTFGGYSTTSYYRFPFPWQYLTNSSAADVQENWSNINASNTRWIRLGSGSTPPTSDDHALEDEFSTSIISLSGSTSPLVGEDSGNIIFQVFVTNKSSEDITIREVGFIGNVRTYAATTTAQDKWSPTKHLLDRTVLKDTITLPGSYSTNFNYEIAFNFAP